MNRALGCAALLALAACERARPATTVQPDSAVQPALESPVRAPVIPGVRVVMRGTGEGARAQDAATPPAGAAEGRVLSPGDHIAIHGENSQSFDIGLAARVRVGGPAVVATDPDGERRLYVLGGHVTASISPDSAARPFAIELATPCGVVRVPRAAEVTLDLTESGVCTYALSAGAADLSLASVNAERRALESSRLWRCAAGSACVAVLAEGRTAAGPAPALDVAGWRTYRGFLGEQLDAAAADAHRLRTVERRALARVRPNERTAEAFAVQRSLALGAAQGLRAREIVYRLRASYRAAGLAESASFGADPRESAVSAALLAEP